MQGGRQADFLCRWCLWWAGGDGHRQLSVQVACTWSPDQVPCHLFGNFSTDAECKGCASSILERKNASSFYLMLHIKCRAGQGKAPADKLLGCGPTAGRASASGRFPAAGGQASGRPGTAGFVSHPPGHTHGTLLCLQKHFPYHRTVSEQKNSCKPTMKNHMPSPTHS